MVAAVGTGAVTPALLAELADAVLDIDEVRLASEVRAGGPHAVRRALELAALLLARALADAPDALRGVVDAEQRG